MSLSLGPCLLDDLAEAHAFEVASSGVGAATAWIVMRAAREAGPCWSILDEAGAPVLVGGLLPIASGFEAWFAPTPRLRGRFLEALALVRLTLLAHAYREIMVVCRTPAGARIAAFCGFSRRPDINGMEIWACPQLESCSAVETRAKSRRSSRPQSSAAGSSPSSPASKPKSTRPRRVRRPARGAVAVS